MHRARAAVRRGELRAVTCAAIMPAVHLGSFVSRRSRRVTITTHAETDLAEIGQIETSLCMPPRAARLHTDIDQHVHIKWQNRHLVQN